MAHAWACGCSAAPDGARFLETLSGDLHRARAGLPRRRRPRTLEEGVAAHRTEIVHLTPAISERASVLIDELALSHGLRLADALIGATAVELGATLLTANVRHFTAIHGLKIEAFLP